MFLKLFHENNNSYVVILTCVHIFFQLDSENDEILVACEEDFRLYLEQGKGRKIFFCANNKQSFDDGIDESIPMDAEESQLKTCERRSRKSRDEEKQRRHAKKLTEKLKHLEEKCSKEGYRSSEKREHKQAERLEKAKRRVEQIRSIIGSIDPANLNSTNNSNEQTTDFNVGASTSASDNAAIHPSPETIRVLSSAIAGCLQPCNLINKILNEVIGMIPQMEVLPPPYTENQQSESPKQQTSQATNTSDANSPVAVRQASHEIEALFKEAAKELEKMNEIVNCSKSVMETSSTGSSSTGATAETQIERTFANITDSAISNATVINVDPRDATDGNASMFMSLMDDEFKSATPSKLMRSRESSIEVHDVNSMISDDSRDWTILDQEEDMPAEVEPANIPLPDVRVVNAALGAIPKKLSVDNGSQVDVDLPAKQESISIETQTPTSLLSDATQQELQASVQKSIEIVQKSIESIQKTMENAKEKSLPPVEQKVLTEIVAQPVEEVVPPKAAVVAPPYGFLYQQFKQSQEQAKAPLEQPKVAQENKPSVVKFEPAVVVYDPNPKINAAVHTMMNMGFTNEGN